MTTTTQITATNLADLPPSLKNIPTLEELPALREKAEDPYKLIESIVDFKSKEAMKSIKMIGAGSSPWIQLAALLAASRISN